MPEENIPYCNQCGEDEKLAYGNTYASGTEITCKVCGQIFQCDLDRYDKEEQMVPEGKSLVERFCEDNNLLANEGTTNFINRFLTYAIEQGKVIEIPPIVDATTLYNVTRKQLKNVEYKLSEANKLIEELKGQGIKVPSYDTGREGCTYSDTEYSSEDVVYGYNLAIDDFKRMNNIT